MSACTAENVTQLEQALDEIYRQHSHGVAHAFASSTDAGGRRPATQTVARSPEGLVGRTV